MKHYQCFIELHKIQRNVLGGAYEGTCLVGHHVRLCWRWAWDEDKTAKWILVKFSIGISVHQ